MTPSTGPAREGAAAATADAAFPRLLTPLRLRGVTLKNRLFFPAMGIDLANADGSFSDELADFYLRMARGGCGLVVLSNASVSPDSILQQHGLRLFEAHQAQALGEFLRQADQTEAIVAVQLQHYGGQATTVRTGKPVLTPSGIASASAAKRDADYRTQRMSLSDIETVKQQFAYAARLAVQAGARFVQMQASNGYLLSSFLSPYTNRRDDEYGGSPRRRARFVAEVVAAVRKELGPERALGLRVGINDCIGAEGMVVDDMRDIVPLLEEAGADFLEASISVAETFHTLIDRTPERQAFLEEQLREFRRYTTVPVGFAGFVDSLEKAEHYLATGLTDMVGMARALFADNELIVKTLSGRAQEIDRCLWDGKCFRDKSNPAYGRVYCCVNPHYKRPELAA